MGHVLGAEKLNFLIRGAEADEATGRPRRFNPVNPCPRGLPGVTQGRYYTRANAYTARAGASSARFLSQVAHWTMNSLAMASALREHDCRSDGVCGTGDDPLPDLPREREPIPAKKCAIWTRWRPSP